MSSLGLVPLPLTQYDQYVLIAADKFRGSFEVAEAERMRLSCVYPQLESQNAILIGRHSPWPPPTNISRVSTRQGIPPAPTRMSLKRETWAPKSTSGLIEDGSQHPPSPSFPLPRALVLAAAHTVRLTMSLNCSCCSSLMVAVTNTCSCSDPTLVPEPRVQLSQRAHVGCTHIHCVGSPAT